MASRKRVRISHKKIIEISRERGEEFLLLTDFVKSFGMEVGLVKTSLKRIDTGTKFEYFQLFKIVDKQKYFLAKIKYGI